MSITHSILLDVSRSGNQATCVIPQGDTDHIININLNNSGAPVSLDGCTALLCAKKPDGTSTYTPCRIVDGTISVTVEELTVSALGAVNCNVQIIRNEDVLTTDADYTSTDVSLICGFRPAQVVFWGNRGENDFKYLVVDKNYADDDGNTVFFTDEGIVYTLTDMFDDYIGYVNVIYSKRAFSPEFSISVTPTVYDDIDHTGGTSSAVVEALMNTASKHTKQIAKNAEDIDSLEDRMDTTEDDIDDLDGRMDTAESDIDGVEGRMNTAEGDISSLESRMTLAETGLTNVIGDVYSAEQDIIALDERVTTCIDMLFNEVDKDIIALDGRVTTAEGSITSLGTRTTAAEGDISGLKARMNTAEADIDALDGRIDDIEDIIPAQATSSNELADKDFVNSSINNIAAFYITKNALGDAFATKAELTAATTFYSGGAVRVPTRNDYCVVLADESKTDPITSENPTTRYIYGNGVWSFQYVVNNSGLTSAQFKALNSGITVEKRTAYDSHVADNDIHTSLADKARLATAETDIAALESDVFATFPSWNLLDPAKVKSRNSATVSITDNGRTVKVTGTQSHAAAAWEIPAEDIRDKVLYTTTNYSAADGNAPNLSISGKIGGANKYPPVYGAGLMPHFDDGSVVSISLITNNTSTAVASETTFHDVMVALIPIPYWIPYGTMTRRERDEYRLESIRHGQTYTMPRAISIASSAEFKLLMADGLTRLDTGFHGAPIVFPAGAFDSTMYITLDSYSSITFPADAVMVGDAPSFATGQTWYIHAKNKFVYLKKIN